MNPKFQSLRSALVCPDCRTPLGLNEPLRCAGCDTVFENMNGVPKLWPPSRAAEISKTVETFRAPRAGVRDNAFFRALLPPNPICDPGATARENKVKQAMQGGVVLNLGSKTARWGEHVVNLDLVLPLGQPESGSVDLLADIQRLPFANNSVDGVICTYVLEHVPDAQVCIDEITRIVKPGGHVYVTVPFLFPTHPDPLDRWRWTLDGLRYSMGAFEELSAGPSGGAFSAYVSIMPTLMGSLFSNFYLFNATRFALGWLLWPMKFLDLIASRSEKNYMTAANFYFFGRKK